MPDGALARSASTPFPQPGTSAPFRSSLRTSTSTTSMTLCARAQGHEKFVQLRERLDRRIRRPGAGSVESFLRGIELVHDQHRLAALFLECTRGDRPIFTTFL